MNNKNITINEIKGLRYCDIFQKITGIEIRNSTNHKFTRIIRGISTPTEGDFDWMEGNLGYIYSIISN